MIKIIVLLLFGNIAYGALTEADKAFINGRNMLLNPGFEQSKAKWTASGGTFTTTTTAANVGTGNAAGSWDSSGSSQTLTATAVTIPSGMYGRNAVATCNIKTATGTATHLIQAYDGTNIVASTTITSVTTYVRTSLNFVAPSSGSLSLRLVSVASDEPIIYIDNCYLGPADGFNVSTISQAVLYGTLRYAGAASCQWTRTANATYGNFTADTDCAAATVTGFASAPGTKIPAIVFSSLPAGEYEIIATGGFMNNGSTNTCNFRFHDGTTGTAGNIIFGSGSEIVPTISGRLSYTSAQGSTTINIQASGGNGNQACDIYNANASMDDLEIKVYKFPSTSEQSYAPELLANSWSGYHATDCSWARTNTAYGDPATDGSCTLTERTNQNFGTVSGSNDLPKITFTPKRAGKYEVCLKIQATVSANTESAAIQLTDGTTQVFETGVNTDAGSGGTYQHTTACGQYLALSTTSVTLKLQTKSATGAVTIGNTAYTNSIEWSIKQIDQHVPYPAIVNTVVSPNRAQEAVARARFNNDGANCTITSQSGSWVQSVVRTGIGNCTITLTSGYFSAAPTCTCTAILNTNKGFCQYLTTPTTTTVDTQLGNHTGGEEDKPFDLICMGPR